MSQTHPTPHFTLSEASEQQLFRGRELLLFLSDLAGSASKDLVITPSRLAVTLDIAADLLNVPLNYVPKQGETA